MKKAQLHINTKRGFSLVELLVSISIFLVFVIAISDVIRNVSIETRNSANRERATVLAEEALEATRNIRDADFANLTDGNYGISTSGNIFSLLGSSDITDIFTRVLSISTINANQKKARVIISWPDQISQNNTVTMDTYLTNWRAPLSIGLTVDKVVIGGTKIPSDFLPINLNTNVWDNTVDPPVLQNINIPIVFSPSTMSGLSPGVYTFSTSSDPDYTLSLSSACLGNSITLTDGATACTITYTANSIDCTGTPWGTMVDGISNIAYATSSVTYPSTCVSEVRTCTTGILSGSYTNTSCSVTPVAPTVTTTTPVTSITKTTAIGGGNITSNGGATVTVSGLVWSTALNPTIALPTKTTDGWALGGPWTSNMDSLTCNTLYHVRAYATNSVGTSYGSDVLFTTAACSSITFIGFATASGTIALIPDHNAGDLLVAFAYRDGDTAAPSLASGWTNISSSTGSNSNGSRLAYRIATGSDSGVGWSNATEIIVQVYRGVSISPIGVNGVQSGNGDPVTYKALLLSITNGTSWVIGFAGHRSTNTNLQNPPTGMIQRSSLVDGRAEVAGHDTNGGVSSWTAKNVTVGGGSSGWMTRTLEIKSN